MALTKKASPKPHPSLPEGRRVDARLRRRMPQVFAFEGRPESGPVGAREPGFLVSVRGVVGDGQDAGPARDDRARAGGPPGDAGDVLGDAQPAPEARGSVQAGRRDANPARLEEGRMRAHQNFDYPVSGNA